MLLPLKRLRWDLGGVFLDSGGIREVALLLTLTRASSTLNEPSRPQKNQAVCLRIVLHILHWYLTTGTAEMVEVDSQPAAYQSERLQGLSS